MKSSRSRKLTPVIAVLLAAAPGWAHHGSEGFDRNKAVHLIGKVSQVDWTNPHVVIHLEAADAAGKAATWLINTLPPNAAMRGGFTKDAFAAGTNLTIDGYQAEDGSNRVNASSIVLPGGRKIDTPGCFDAAGHGLKWGSKDCVAH